MYTYLPLHFASRVQSHGNELPRRVGQVLQ
jgi:hypothetical protein